MNEYMTDTPVIVNATFTLHRAVLACLPYCTILNLDRILGHTVWIYSEYDESWMNPWQIHRLYISNIDTVSVHRPPLLDCLPSFYLYSVYLSTIYLPCMGATEGILEVGSDRVMVLVLDGDSEHVAHEWRRTG